MNTIEPGLAAVLDAYRVCEFTTLAKDGTPLTWPAAPLRRPDGTLLVTTSIAFPQKAFNVRRDGRVAMLFSDPTGSGLDSPPQILVRGTAACPDEIVSSPEGLEPYWRMLFHRRPGNRAHLRPPMTWLMDWYYLRLLISVTPTEVITLPAMNLTSAPATVESEAPGAAELARTPTAVLGACDADGTPVLARTHAVPTSGGFTVEIPEGVTVAAGPASLLVHRHDENLAGLMNALIRGTLTANTAGSWLLTPERVVEPMPGNTPREQVAVLRARRRAARAYLARRGLRRPRVRWDLLRELAVS
ncbi:hypothetical protein KIH74_24110 [Kineosporia sp. J2-2]|uniref:Pyridoxamine 5'-phosphate oxidase n=1 Tax=Kineosporia corallincola TaxID=2835133 RepID=A0ABS5TNU3_9ACTN|nr:pyridoxamine 5'-phosphate oxidase family protein [Kineosporia corallincola]MBT0772049.1 hypothetical protein [Kineosporia corallincola]